MKAAKNILFGLLMVMIGLPLLQHTVPIFDVKPLKGAFKIPSEPTATFDSLFQGTYQDAYNDYFEHNIGFRPLLVRVNNQIAFSVFDTALASGVVIGKKNYLYEIKYVVAYKGWDFIGQEKVNDIVVKSAFVNQKLRESGKTLMLVFAPGKATFFPEYIPDNYLKKPSGAKTNYEALRQGFISEQLPLIDFNKWFVQMKDTASYPLYSQTGIHWSAYGMALSLDSLIRYIETDRSISMVDFGWDGFDLPDTLRSPDNDIAEGMNLLFDVPHYPMAYPRIRFGSTEGKVRPNAIVVADSYYWSIFGPGYASRIFNEHTFWYYNKQVFNPKWDAPLSVSELSLAEYLGKTDVIIIMATEANLYRFTYGFIEAAYDALNSGQTIQSSKPAEIPASVKESEIEKIMQAIDANKKWREQVQQKATAKGISYQKMLQLDAGWVWEHNNK